MEVWLLKIKKIIYPFLKINYVFKDNPFLSLEGLWWCKFLFKICPELLWGAEDKRANIKRYPPREPLSHLEMRAMVVEERPVLSIIALYWTSLESRRVASSLLPNSSISPAVIRSRKKASASLVFSIEKIVFLRSFKSFDSNVQLRKFWIIYFLF